MTANADGQATIKPTINLSDDAGDERTELGNLNPWTDTTNAGLSVEMHVSAAEYVS
jgi:hypothetical protein